MTETTNPTPTEPTPIDDSWFESVKRPRPSFDGLSLDEIFRITEPTERTMPEPVPAWRPAEPEDTATDWLAPDLDDVRYVPLVELTEAEQGALGYMQMLIEAVEQGERLTDSQACLLTLARLLAQSEK